MALRFLIFWPFRPADRSPRRNIPFFSTASLRFRKMFSWSGTRTNPGDLYFFPFR
jgi:hypothetical protein